MKKALKRSLSFLLAITIIFSSAYVGLSEVDFSGFFAVKAKAASSGSTGDCNWELDGTVLTISGNGTMGNYTYSSVSLWGTDITKVVIENGVTSIGRYAFYNCNEIRSITIPDSVTIIGDSAFYNCSNLASVTIGNGVRSIGDEAFGRCFKLNAVYITDLVAWCNISFDNYDTLDSSYGSNPVYYAENLYLNNELITNLVIPEGVTSIGRYAFYNCTSITSITIPDSVMNIGAHAFNGCINLADLYITDLSSWCAIKFDENTSNPLMYARNLYVNGEYVTALIIPDGVTSIEDYSFYFFLNVSSITIPDSVTSIGRYAFYNCNEIRSITIPDSVTSIGESAFANCQYLTSITLPESVTSIGRYAFFGCDNLTSITIPGNVTRIGNSTFFGCDNLTSVTIPDSVTYIGDSAFSNCDNLTSITIPDSVAHIGDLAFENCDGLTSVTIPINVTSLGSGVFADCDSLKEAIILCKVTSLRSYRSSSGNYTGFFDGCNSLASVLIPESVTSIGSRAFWNCDNLTIYGISGSYAQTYAQNNNIPFKDISEFGSVNIVQMVAAGIAFNVYNKNIFLKGDALGIASGSVNSAVEGASITYNNKTEVCEHGDKLNSRFITLTNLSGQVEITKGDFYDYVIPSEVITNFKDTSNYSLNVYLTEDRNDGKPYISTVFGRIYDDDSENTYEELQTNSLNVLKDKTYDIIVTADLKGEESATYYLSQDINHRISSETGVFSAVEIYSKFDENKPAYAYAVTSSGKVTEPVSIGLEKIVCSEAATALLSSSKVNLLGSNTTGLTISDSIPIIGGTELSMSLVELPIGVEIEGERVRISIGRDFYKYSTENGKEKENEWISFKECCKEIDKEMKSGKDVKDKYNAFEKAKKERGFGNDNIKTTKKAGLSWDASYMGYIEGYFIDGDIVFTDFCGSVAASFIAQYTVNGSIGPVPAYFYVKGGIDGAFSLNLTRQIPDTNIPLQFDATIALTPNAKVGGGVGTKGIASAGIYGSLSIPTILEIMDKHLTLSITASVGVEGEILFWSGEKELASGTWNVIDKYFGASEASLGDFSEAVYSEMSELVYSNTPKVEYSLASRDYAESTSGWVGYTNSGDLANGIIGGMQEPLYSSGIMSSATVTELQTSVYKNSQTQLVQFGDKVMLAYIEDSAERDTYNRYRLMYTIYNPSTNVWTEPKAVCDSGKMDISPSLATDGEDVYIAWQTVNTNPTDVTEEELYNALNNVEIYSAKYDSSSDSFVNVTKHTSNSTYDYSPYVTVENGSDTVYWVNAESLDYAVGEMSIHSSADSSNTLIYDDLNYITTIKASGSEISYSMDADGDLNTVNDIKLFTNGVQVGENIVYDTAVVTNFTYGDFNGTETLFYSDGGTVYYIENGESVEAFSDDGGIADSLIITNLNGNPAVIYTQLTDMGSELRISTFENDAWSEPVTLTDIGCLISNVDAVSVNGKIYSVFDRTQTTAVTDEETGEAYLEYGQTDLCMLTSEGYYDLEVSNIGYDEGDVSVGSSSPFIVVVENKGTETINDVEFIVSDSQGYSKTITKEINLASGAIESVELEYVAQNDYGACDLTVTATIVGVSDVDTNNNTTSEKIGRTDISVGAISTERIGDIYKINCEVINDSLIDAENVALTISFDIYEKMVDVGTIEAKSTYIAELLVSKSELIFDENDVCTLTFGASTDSEEIVLGNNENTVTVDNSDKLVEHVHNFVDNICDGCGMQAFLWEATVEGITITGCNLIGDKIIIPDKIGDVVVTSMSASVFVGNEIPSTVIIPVTVTSIETGAFAGCTGLKYVFYAGTEVDWTKVSIGSNNSPLTDAPIHYSSTGEHRYSTEWTIDITPTCTQPGSKSHHCIICDIKTDITEIAISSHSYSDWVISTAPTCTEAGSQNKTCSVCGDVVTEVISACHTYPAEWTIDVDPTCTTDGSRHKDCSVCGDVVTEVISACHTYPAEWTIDVDPTCTTDGSRHKDCSVCGDVVTEVISACHTYPAEWTIDVDPTCITDGSKHKDCLVCGNSVTEVISATDHSYSNEWTIDVAPTCIESGSKSHHCTVCDNKTDVTVISAIGHSYVDGYCSVCSKEKTIESAHPYEDNTEETWTIYKEGANHIAITFSEDTETESNWDYIYIYNAGGEEVGCYSGTELAGKRIGVFGDKISITLKTDGSNTYYGFALSNIEVSYEECTHPETEIRNAYAATCTYDGFTGDSYCVDCDVQLSEGEAISATGHSMVDDECEVCGASIWEYEINNDEVTITKYNGSDSAIVIPETIEDLPVTAIGEYAFYGDDELTSITFHEGITSVGERAFGNCSNIEDFYVPSLEAYLTINFYKCVDGDIVDYDSNPMYYADNLYCGNEILTDIVIPETITEIPAYAFFNCESLSTVTFHNGITKVGFRAFGNCDALEKVNISDIASWCTTIFSDDWDYHDDISYYDSNPLCSGADLYLDNSIVKNLVIPDTVTYIYFNTFRDCNTITSVYLPSSLTYLYYDTFAYCDDLTDIIFEGSEEEFLQYDSGESYAENFRVHYDAEPNHLTGVKESDPTCSTSGVINYSCDCGYEFTINIPALGHTWVDGICSVCGADVDDCIESSHPYENDLDNCWTIYKEGANRIAITFSEDTYTEWDFDEIFIYDSSDEVVSYYSGTRLAGKRIVVYGDTIKIRLVSDGSVTEYGFKVTNVEVFYEECTHSETEVRNILDANCCNEGYTGDTCCTECGLLLAEGEYTPANENAHDLYTVVVDANCVEGGYERNICSYCDYYEIISETEPTGVHSYENGLCPDCGDEDPNSSVPVLSIGETKTATITNYGDYYYFYFTPEINGVYSFFSSTDYNTRGYIYDSSFNRLQSNDDGGYDYNFNVTCYLEAGEKYIIGCRYFGYDYTGSFDVSCSYDLYAVEGTKFIGNYMYISCENTRASDFVTVSDEITLDCVPSLVTLFGSYFGTGSEFNYTDEHDNSYSYTIIVEGDVDGDSVCDALDAWQVGLASNGHKDLDGAYALAADSNEDDVVDINDYQSIVNKAVS